MKNVTIFYIDYATLELRILASMNCNEEQPEPVIELVTELREHRHPNNSPHYRVLSSLVVPHVPRNLYVQEGQLFGSCRGTPNPEPNAIQMEAFLSGLGMRLPSSILTEAQDRMVIELRQKLERGQHAIEQLEEARRELVQERNDAQDYADALEAHIAEHDGITIPKRIKDRKAY